MGNVAIDAFSLGRAPGKVPGHDVGSSPTWLTKIRYYIFQWLTRNRERDGRHRSSRRLKEKGRSVSD